MWHNDGLSNHHFGSDSQWPAQWDGADLDRWPRLAPHRWHPKKAGKVLAVCLGDGGKPTEWRSFPSIEAAEEAERQRAGHPCCEACLGQHALTWVGGQPLTVHVVRAPTDRFPVPASLGVALIAAGYTAPVGRTGSSPVSWPKPSILNRPLEPHHNGHPPKEVNVSPRATPPEPEPEAAVTDPDHLDDEQVDAILRAERAAGRHLAKIGLNRRAVAAYRELADLQAAGADPDRIAEAEMVAKALTNAALADLTGD